MSNTARERLDIVIPVYNEGANIVPTLRAIARDVKTPGRVLICYDLDEDDTGHRIRTQPQARRPRGGTNRICPKRCAIRARIPG